MLSYYITVTVIKLPHLDQAHMYLLLLFMITTFQISKYAKQNNREPVTHSPSQFSVNLNAR